MTHAIDLQLIAIPAQTIQLGEAADAHTVTLDAFQIGQYPVTAVQYAEFIRDTRHQPPRYWLGEEPHPMYATHPVVDVSWFDSLAFCGWLGQQLNRPFHLPTEAEWEHAARGKDGLTYPWGDAFYKDKCNNWEYGHGRTCPVDTFPDGASPYGVVDMAGNVWEWCSSIYQDYPYDPADGRENLLDTEAWRVLRGGSWYDTEWGVRAARRFGSPADYISHNTGFRVACSVSSP